MDKLAEINFLKPCKLIWRFANKSSRHSWSKILFENLLVPRIRNKYSLDVTPVMTNHLFDKYPMVDNWFTADTHLSANLNIYLSPNFLTARMNFWLAAKAARPYVYWMRNYQHFFLRWDSVLCYRCWRWHCQWRGLWFPLSEFHIKRYKKNASQDYSSESDHSSGLAAQVIIFKPKMHLIMYVI